MTGSGLYVAERGDASAQGDGTYLWRSNGGRTCALVSACELDLLDHCTSFETLAAHAANAASALGIGIEQARAELERLRARGLLAGLDEALASAPAKAAPMARPRVVVRAASVDERLRALLAALATTPAGSEPPTVFVLLRDDVHAADMPSVNGLNARFYDAALRRRHWQTLAAGLEADTRTRAARLLGVDGGAAWQRASWNWALLLGRGGGLAVLDTDDHWPPRLAPRLEPGLTLRAPGRHRAWAAVGVAALGLGPPLDDALGLATPYLGQPALALAASYPDTAARARGASRESVLWPAFDQRVRGIACGDVADAAQLVARVRCVDDAADAATLEVAAALQAGLAPPGAVAAYVPRTGCLVRTSALPPLFLDARELLPPMPSAGGYAAWSALLAALDAHAVILELPVLRLRSGSPDLDCAATEALPSIIHAAASGFVGPRVAPTALAARFAELATAADAVLARLVAIGRDDVAVRQLALLDTVLRTQDAGSAKRAVLANWRDALAQRMLDVLPVDAAELVRRELAELATALPAWTELWFCAERVDPPS